MALRASDGPFMLLDGIYQSLRGPYSYDQLQSLSSQRGSTSDSLTRLTCLTGYLIRIRLSDHGHINYQALRSK